jgi:Short C-terminal domain
MSHNDIKTHEIDMSNGNVPVISPFLIERFEYDIEIVDNGDLSLIDEASRVTINIQESGNTLEFSRKKTSDPLLKIPLANIETVTAVTIPTKHLMSRKNNLLLEIVFRDDKENNSLYAIQNERCIRFDLDDKYVNILQEQINLLKDVKNNLRVQNAIALLEDPKLCNACAKRRYSYVLHLDNLCIDCFVAKYGQILLQANVAEYYGGHKAYLAGGVFSKYQTGKMYLTEHYFLFIRGDKDQSKRWEIVIPFSSIIMERWHVEEVGRRQTISGAGSSIDNLAFGGGSIHESGKEHHIVIPYVDENGIPQEPRFGVSSFRGKAIREWSSKLYEQVAKARKNDVSQRLEVHTSNNESSQTSDDPVKILKLRFAKGEISKEEYEEMRKVIESQ